jgi:hypothetical protein
MAVADRREPRQRTLLKGEVTYSAASSARRCLVRDMSGQGAMLVFPHPIAPPRDFSLYIPQRRETHGATVVWHDGNRVGVVFRTRRRGQEKANLGSLERELPAIIREVIADHLLASEVDIAREVQMRLRHGQRGEGDQPYQLAYFARKHGLTRAQARKIIERCGPDRARANREAKRVSRYY